MSVRGIETIIRPAAILSTTAANLIMAGLARADVSKGGLWNASSTVWQRYDHPWNGENGGRGDAMVVGTIAVIYDQPRQHEITIYKVSITDGGVEKGWTTERVCDDALSWANLTLASCPRASMPMPPKFDPFRDGVDEAKRAALLAPDATPVDHQHDDMFGTRRVV